MNDRVSSFHKAIQDGPYYVCIVCNRTLYRRTVQIFDISKYNISEIEVFSDVKNYDGEKYICTTCHKNLIDSKIPQQANQHISEEQF